MHMDLVTVNAVSAHPVQGSSVPQAVLLLPGEIHRRSRTRLAACPAQP